MKMLMTPILVEVVSRSRAEKLFVAEDFIIAENYQQDYRVLAVSPKNDALILLASTKTIQTTPDRRFRDRLDIYDGETP